MAIKRTINRGFGGFFFPLNTSERRNLFKGVLKTVLLYMCAPNMQTLVVFSFYFHHFTHRRTYPLLYRGQKAASSGIRLCCCCWIKLGLHSPGVQELLSTAPGLLYPSFLLLSKRTDFLPSVNMCCCLLTTNLPSLFNEKSDSLLI